MNENIKKTIKLIKGSKNILLVLPPNPNHDFLTSAFALYYTLKKYNNCNVTIFCNELELSKQGLEFLKQPEKEAFISSLDGSRDFLLIFNTEYNKIIKIKTEKKEKKVIIRLTPEKGSIDPRDFSLAPADFKYDLAIIIGAPTLNSLGKLYADNTDLFFEVPKININNSSDNDDYGQVNIVNLTTPSVSEIIADLIKQLTPEMIDQNIAQTLLTGVISATDSFQKATTTPQTMLMAAELIKAKANQSEIIKNLYKTKPLSFLKIWGRAMARLNWDSTKKFIWSLLSVEDFLKSRTDKDVIPMVMKELQKNYPRAKIFGLFYGEEKSTEGFFIINNPHTIKSIAEEYNTTPLNDNTLKINFKNKNPLKAEKDFQIALDKNL